MEDIIDTKLRRIGDSFGVLIPKKIIEKEHLKAGENIEIIVVKTKKKEILDKAFGVSKGARPFKRESSDRF